GWFQAFGDATKPLDLAADVSSCDQMMYWPRRRHSRMSQNEVLPWTLAIALFGVGLLLACWLVFPGGRMEVRLIMLGYTNESFSTLGYTNLPPSMQGGKGYIPVAVLRATNTGSVPVKLWDAVSSQDMNDPGFAKPRFPLREVINPGESLEVTVSPP